MISITVSETGEEKVKVTETFFSFVFLILNCQLEPARPSSRFYG